MYRIIQRKKRHVSRGLKPSGQGKNVRGRAIRASWSCVWGSSVMRKQPCRLAIRAFSPCHKISNRSRYHRGQRGKILQNSDYQHTMNIRYFSVFSSERKIVFEFSKYEEGFVKKKTTNPSCLNAYHSTPRICALPFDESASS